MIKNDMKKIFPQKLKKGDEVRVIAPSRSLGIINQTTRDIANHRLADLGLKVTFGQHVDEIDDFLSSSVASRISDLHAAFADKNVKAILTVIGGFNSNQLLDQIDWSIIQANPKIFCGYSDITILNNAILAKTGLVTYYGPHYSTFGQKIDFDFTLEWFKKILFKSKSNFIPVELNSSSRWSDDIWWLNQDQRDLIPNSSGWRVIQTGQAKGRIVGGNLNTLNLLQGTAYWPGLKNSLLFLEDDELSFPASFDRDLQSLIHQPDFRFVRGLVIGRFQKKSNISLETLIKIILAKPELRSLPIVANVDFGHTDPKLTLPIGGEAELDLGKKKKIIRLLSY